MTTLRLRLVAAAFGGSALAATLAAALTPAPLRADPTAFAFASAPPVAHDMPERDAHAMPEPVTHAMPAPDGWQATADTVRFVVLGHLRGNRDRSLHYLLDELLSEVAEFRPDFAVLTGDLIWGDPRGVLDDKSVVEEEYDRLDAKLGTLGVPIFRVPGNHDVNDRPTWELFSRRYGEVPRTVDVGRTRLVLLSTVWQPDLGPRAPNAGFDLGPGQLAFLRHALEDPTAYGHAFVFLHHSHFWQDPDQRWWTEVHPLLRQGGVRAVFSGDYGPQQKYSHERRDGIDFYQSGIAPDPELGILKGHEWNRILAGQFDNFMEVTIVGEDVDIDVHTVGESSSPHWTPERWKAVWGTIHRWGAEPGGLERLRAFLGTGKAKLFTAGVLGLAFAVGFGLGWWLRR